MVGNVPFLWLCSFWCVAVNTVNELQFLSFILCCRENILSAQHGGGQLWRVSLIPFQHSNPYIIIDWHIHITSLMLYPSLLRRRPFPSSHRCPKSACQFVLRAARQNAWTVCRWYARDHVRISNVYKPIVRQRPAPCRCHFVWQSPACWRHNSMSFFIRWLAGMSSVWMAKYFYSNR